MKFVKQTKVLLALILLGAALLRFYGLIYGLNWDQGHHLHPDERAIVMFTTPLHFPKGIGEFLSPQSPLNPHFFAYGNFPLYLLKAAASLLANFDPLYLTYEKINLVGRAISAIADIGTVVLIFLIGKKLFTQTVGLLAAFFYTISVFPIQTAHFYAVDTLLTFFIILTLYQLVRFYEKPSIQNSILVGLFFGFSLATKISAIPLVVAVITTIVVDFTLIVIKQPHKPHIWFPHVPHFLKRLIFNGVTIAVVTAVIFAILQPYAIIDFQEFLRQTQQQSQMTRDAFTFPYTLQYVGKTPYFYELKNIFLWGQGPILATLSFLGTLYVSLGLIMKHLGWWRSDDFDSSEVDVHARKTMKQWNPEKSANWRINGVSNGTIIILVFLWFYFFIVGNFKVGWMRYMLPLYPLLVLFAAFFIYRLLSFRANQAKPEKSRNLMHKPLMKKIPPRSGFAGLVGMTVIILILVWPLSFMHIYTKTNTRVLASQWIYQNIPPNKIIAREHWDDGLPLGGNIFYQTLELPIYDMQNPSIEAQIYQTIQKADYIIIASNRLYAPLQRISKNCEEWKIPKDRCPHNANRYYEKLFNGQNVILNSFQDPNRTEIPKQVRNDTRIIRFQKIAEFAVYPTIPILNIPINDESADESFTVYDHPKVMIFRKTQKL